MVKHENFKTCAQSGFCARNRAYADLATSQASSWASPYRLTPESIAFKNGRLEGTILKTTDNNGETVRLPLVVTFLSSGTARITIDEEKRQKGDIELRHSSKARKERYNEAAAWAIVGDLDVSTTAILSEQKEEGATRVLYGPSNKFEAVIRHQPFSMEFNRDEETQVKFNDRGFLNLEHWRPKIERKEGEEEIKVEGTGDESTWWEESFGGNTDSKPRGPESVALDISFPGYEHVYGIPEHATSLSLKETRYVK
jgi:mannosyl-oligosaccharide alpha-1,3-glucosidase